MKAHDEVHLAGVDTKPKARNNIHTLIQQRDHTQPGQMLLAYQSLQTILTHSIPDFCRAAYTLHKRVQYQYVV